MESKFGSKVHIMDHPLVAHKLTIMRDKNTSVKDFRELVSEIGMLITYEATRDLPLTTKHIETPICEMDAPTLAGRKFVVVPILRAGLGLVDGVLRMVPSARVGHIGLTASVCIPRAVLVSNLAISLMGWMVPIQFVAIVVLGQPRYRDRMAASSILRDRYVRSPRRWA